MKTPQVEVAEDRGVEMAHIDAPIHHTHPLDTQETRNSSRPQPIWIEREGWDGALVDRWRGVSDDDRGERGASSETIDAVTGRTAHSENAMPR